MQVSRLFMMILVMSAMFGPSQAVGGRAGGADPGPALEPEGVARKLKLLETLTRSAKTRARVEQSNNPEAQVHFAAAVSAWKTATVAAADGDMESASTAIGDGYRELTLALRNAEDEPARVQRAARRYDELSGRVFSFAEAFQRIAYEKNDPRIFGLLDQGKLNMLMRDAQSLAARGRHDQANEMLEIAATTVERALSASRDRETLVQQLSFRTRAEEFDYELRRNESYEMLVRLLEQREGAETGLMETRKVLERNATVRIDAREMFTRGEVEEAIIALEAQSAALARVLRRSGLVF